MTLFWLSQVVDYSGPQLDLSPFTSLFPEQQVSTPGETDNLFSSLDQSTHPRLGCTAMHVFVNRTASRGCASLSLPGVWRSGR